MMTPTISARASRKPRASAHDTTAKMPGPGIATAIARAAAKASSRETCMAGKEGKKSQGARKGEPASGRDLAAQIEHGVPGDFHPVAREFAPQFAAARRDLPGPQLGFPEPRGPVGRERAVGGTSDG